MFVPLLLFYLVLVGSLIAAFVYYWLWCALLVRRLFCVHVLALHS